MKPRQYLHLFIGFTLGNLLAVPAFSADAASVVSTTGTTRAVSRIDAMPAVEWPQLKYSREPHLHAALSEKLKQIGLARAAADEKLAVALVDITDPANPRVATVNAHQMMYAASLPKIAILLGAFQKAADGQLEMNAENLNYLTAMIRRSSNPAASIMLKRVGFDYLAEVLQSERYALYDPEMNGGLWVGKAYAKAGAWKRDPLYNLSHAATVFEVARFYYLLETDRLVSPEASAQMRAILEGTTIKHKFVLGLNTARPGSKILRKSGTWRTFHADSAIVERDGRRYIAVAMANHPSGGRWLSQVIVAMDDLIYDQANIDHDHMAETHAEPVGLPQNRAASAF
ncbi:MAG: serine hydrolase [Gammaproteobacteria bacterium]